jgi:hypothetical protein
LCFNFVDESTIKGYIIRTHLETPEEEGTSRRYSTRSSSQSLFPRYSNPEKVYRRRIRKASQSSLKKSLEILQGIKGLFLHSSNQQKPRVGMASWKSNLYKDLEISAIQGAPHDMLEKYSKWLPKFSGNNVISAKEHAEKFQEFLEEHEIEDDHEDVVVKLFALSLEEDARM